MLKYEKLCILDSVKCHCFVVFILHRKTYVEIRAQIISLTWEKLKMRKYKHHKLRETQSCEYLT